MRFRKKAQYRFPAKCADKEILRSIIPLQCLRTDVDENIKETGRIQRVQTMNLSRRDFIKGASSVVISGAVAPLWAQDDSHHKPQESRGKPAARPASFTLESYATNSLNYLEGLVDADGLPYFNVFWTQPAEAAHDWPDFGDVMTRQWQGAVMLRRMAGREAATEKIWRRKALSLIDPSDALLHRPATSYSKPVADWGDASLTLYALVTAAVDSGDDILRQAAQKMAEGMLNGLALRPLSGQWFRDQESHGRGALARLRSRFGGGPDSCRPHDRPRPHVHSGQHLWPFGSHARQPENDGRGRRLCSDNRRPCPLQPHRRPVSVRQDDRHELRLPARGHRTTGRYYACETCALMDFAGIGVTLANHGHPEYWGDMERLARNHYVESQVRDVSWLESDGARPDTAQFTYRDIGQRIRGAWAGWSSPNHILAARETLNAHWGGPELKNKVRVLQNCCGGSGVHGLFILWKNAARFEAGTLSVNMHIDKKLPQAEIRCEQPYRGLLRIALKTDGGVRVRIPDFTSAARMSVRLNGAELPPTATPPFGNYLELRQLRAGDRIEIAYPLPIRTEDIVVGNPGFRQWHYRATWKGDTVVRMEPVDNDVDMAYSDFEKAQVGVFYGRKGPGQLYQRDQMLQDDEPSEAVVHPDDAAGLDFWKIT